MKWLFHQEHRPVLSEYKPNIWTSKCTKQKLMTGRKKKDKTTTIIEDFNIFFLINW